MRYLWLVLLLILPVRADELQQSDLLKRLFRQPRATWAAQLRQNLLLLDAGFFQRVDARVGWDRVNNYVEDGIRFSIMGDFACEAVGRPQHYRRDMFRFLQGWGKDSPQVAAELGQPMVGHYANPNPNSNDSLEIWNLASGCVASTARLDLSTDSRWQLLTASRKPYLVGQKFHLPGERSGERDWAMDRISGTSAPFAGNETVEEFIPVENPVPVTALELDPEVEDYLELWTGHPSHPNRPRLSILTRLRPAESGLSVYCWDGNLVCLRSQEQDAELLRDGERVGRIGEDVSRWQGRLGLPQAIFQNTRSGEVVWLYYAALVDIGLQVTTEKVQAITLAEPGTLKVNLERTGFYRERPAEKGTTEDWGKINARKPATRGGEKRT